MGNEADRPDDAPSGEEHLKFLKPALCKTLVEFFLKCNHLRYCCAPDRNCTETYIVTVGSEDCILLNLFIDMLVSLMQTCPVNKQQVQF